jgi:hypothetical protein
LADHFILVLPRIHLVVGEVPQFLQVLLLLLFVGLCKLGVDDGESQVQKKKGSDEDQRNEEYPYPSGICLLHHALHVTPALKGHALEHAQKGVKKVVKVGHSIVRIFICFAAEVATGAWGSCSSADWCVFVDHTCLNRNTPLFH